MRYWLFLFIMLFLFVGMVEGKRPLSLHSPTCNGLGTLSAPALSGDQGFGDRGLLPNGSKCAIQASNLGSKTVPKYAEIATVSLDTLPIIDAGQITLAERQTVPYQNCSERTLSLSKCGERMNALPLTIRAPQFAEPQTAVSYTVEMVNLTAVTRTYTITAPIPNGLTPLIPTHGTIINQTWHWSAPIPPARLDYVASELSQPLPYIDLAEYGVPNLCALLEEGVPCDDVGVLLNLGAANQHIQLYDSPISIIGISSNGYIVPASQPLSHTVPAPFPHAGAQIAPLWRDQDLTENGRFHAAVLSGFINGQDTLYIQWHDVPHKHNPNSTSRYALALPLGRESFYMIYDNIASPSALLAEGYSIGVGDARGERGVTWAYAPPCCDGSPEPIGTPPTSGATVLFQPLLHGNLAQSTAVATLPMQVVALVPETIPLTVQVTDGVDTHWQTHRLYVRELFYLPYVESQP